MAKGLTKRQADVLDFIVQYMNSVGYPPAFSDIAAEFGITSTNGVADHLAALEKKGYILRSSKARSITLTPKAAARVCAEPEAGATVPLVGRVAAGHPILAVENVEEHIPVQQDLALEGVFALRVQGDSMIEDGIFDGDIIVVNPALPVRDGDIVVALVEDEATVKHLYRRGGMVELRPANREMDSILVRPNQLQLQGVAVALQRRLR